RNDDRTRHLAIYFAGPMRSAGGTEMGMTMIVGDHVRRRLNLQPYKATEGEARRFVEELRIYERAVARFQYRNSDTVLHDAMLRLPVEPNGVETDPVEVAVNRNIARIETNRVRGGALRVINDGLLGRSQKVLRIVERLSLEGWDWLRPLKTTSAEGEEAKEFMFMEDVVGGRPIFAFPGAQGGFRVRYGRARNTGLASVGVHPATMQLLAEKMKTFEADTGVPSLSITKERLHSLATTPLATKPSAREALEISRSLNVPLHPLYTHFWDAIKPNELQYLRERILEFSKPSEETILIPNDAMLKSLLERLCLPHRI